MSTVWYGFINDTKPYHSKLTETAVEYQYDDPMTVTMTDDMSMNIILSSVWQKNNNNPNNQTKLYTSWTSADLSDGTAKYMQFRIPATVFPRFSKDSYLKFEFDGGTDEEYKDLELVSSNVNLTSTIVSSADIFGPQLQGYDTSLYAIEPGYDDSDFINSAPGKSFTFNVSYELVLTYEPGSAITDFYIQGNKQTIGTNYTIDADGVTVRYSNATTMILDTFTTFAGYDILDEAGNLNKSLADAIIRIRLQQYLIPRAFSRDYGCYPVPFHHGSQVKVNGTIKTLGIDYVVGRYRRTIRFLPGKRPQTGDKIEINLFFSDRFFISINDEWKEYYIVPHTHTYASLDIMNFEDFDSVDGGVDDADHLMWSFFDITKPYYKDVFVSGGLDMAGFDESGYSSSQYTPSDAKFTELQWTRDKNYLILKHLFHGKSPKDIITVNIPSLGIIDRIMQIVNVTDSEIYLDIIDTGPISGNDASYEFLYIYNLSEDTQTIFEPYGSIKKVFDENQEGYYVFEWYTIPELDTKIEFRIEQHDQYNSWVVNEFKESVKFYEYLKFSDVCIVNAADDSAAPDPGFDAMEYDQFMFGGMATDFYGRKFDDMQMLFAESPLTNFGNGGVKNIKISDYTTFQTLTLQAVSSTKFKIIGSQTGEYSVRADINRAYTAGNLTFTIYSGTTNFKAGDTFVIKNYIFVNMDRASAMIRQQIPVNKLVIKHNRHGTPLFDVFDYGTDNQITPDSAIIQGEDIVISFNSAKAIDIIISSASSI